ncbi:MAG: hypothetical protein M5U34_24010 [Chloroflexi bacterium]|nr:hypothetical protein [Chloroflexota bacterium]
MIFEDNQALVQQFGLQKRHDARRPQPGLLCLSAGRGDAPGGGSLFHDLPTYTYRQWRYSLTHDEFARWLLYDPQAITAVANVIGDP